jgi:3-dehydroquinate dehydratase
LFKKIVLITSKITEEQFVEKFKTINNSLFDMIEDPIDFLQHEKNKNEFKSLDTKLKEYKQTILSNNKFKFDAEFLFQES